MPKIAALSNNPKKSPDVDSKTSEHFVQGLIARGEAVGRDGNDTLPTGATHEIVTDEKSEATVRRKRFSIF